MRELILQNLPRLVRPLVAFCLRRSIRLGDLVEVIKGVMVEVARAELVERGSGVSTSRISIMTGVHRKDITRLLAAPSAVRDGSDNLIVRLIGRWQQDPRFTGAGGRARVLTVEGRESEFARLVHTISSDLNPYTVLFELERVGAVERTRGGVKLARRIFVPAGDVAGGLGLLADDAADLFAALDENIFTPAEVPNLHIKTQYDNIPVEALPEVRAWLFREGSAFHQRARTFFGNLDRDTSRRPVSGSGRLRVALGSFSRVSPHTGNDQEIA